MREIGLRSSGKVLYPLKRLELRAFAPPVPLPKMTIIPSRKPRLYQFPLLCTSYIRTFRLKRDITNVTGAIIPFQRPRQKPATIPFSLAELASSFAPGAHPASIISANARMIRINVVFIPSCLLRAAPEYSKILQAGAASVSTILPCF